MGMGWAEGSQRGLAGAGSCGGLVDGGTRAGVLWGGEAARHARARQLTGKLRVLERFRDGHATVTSMCRARPLQAPASSPKQVRWEREPWGGRGESRGRDSARLPGHDVWAATAIRAVASRILDARAEGRARGERAQTVEGRRGTRCGWRRAHVSSPPARAKPSPLSVQRRLHALQRNQRAICRYNSALVVPSTSPACGDSRPRCTTSVQPEQPASQALRWCAPDDMLDPSRQPHRGQKCAGTLPVALRTSCCHQTSRGRQVALANSMLQCRLRETDPLATRRPGMLLCAGQYM
ncbi:hypothetical protein EJ04DRAFT_520668 [Polyplosphaeria fusca]|uniref:Uncharacterized protein n=1 Tax=Polyplosphaeria fusca TaxID=682080 RepID=A0A9P4V6D3_9PLEO|nr:hypothetical protein EJ04DRAFT_520668 [Polyplosphaeria fusca]